MRSDHEIRCRECGGLLVVSDYGELVCSNCGLIVDVVYMSPLFEIEPLSDFTASSKVYVNPDGKPIRNDGLGSIILRCKGQFKDHRGAILDSKKFSKLKNINDLCLKFNLNKTKINALNVLNRVCSLLRVPRSVYERSCYIYVKAFKHSRGVGSSYLIAAASLIIAARELEYPLTLSEVSDSFTKIGHRVIVRSLSKAISMILERLKLKYRVPNPQSYIPKIISRLRSNYRVKRLLDDYEIDHREYFLLLERESYRILCFMDDKLKLGKNPYLLAVSTVYVSDKIITKKLGLRPMLSQKLLSIYLGSTEYTIRHHSKVIMKIVRRVLES